MKNLDSVLTFKEAYSFELRQLYARYGYTPYRMGKFEEYDLYSKNKDFLISDSVITFMDADGKLKALKPDVTLSIIKNNRALSGRTEKLYYNENVYRVQKGSNSFKEIMQAGVECIGDIDSFLLGESLYLAAKSLELYRPSNDFVLNVSSLDILLSFITKMTDDVTVRDELIKCVSEKNTHEIIGICRTQEIEDSLCEALCKLTGIYGKARDTIEKAEALCEQTGEREKAQELKKVLSVFEGSALYDHINIDFSVVSDPNYYNGIIFKGYVPGTPLSVLSGGQYDKLMRKMHRKSRAVGFAVYLDMLEGPFQKDCCDVDILLLYDEDTPPDVLRQTMERLSENGETVRALKRDDPKLKYRKQLRLNSFGETE